MPRDEERISGGMAAEPPGSADSPVPPDAPLTAPLAAPAPTPGPLPAPSELLRSGVDAVEAAVLSGQPHDTAAAGQRPTPQPTPGLLEELRAATARMFALDRRLGAPRVLADATRHARTLSRLLPHIPEHNPLRSRLLLGVGEAALLNAFLALDQDETVVGGRWARLATMLGHLGGSSDLAATAVALQAKFLVDQDDSHAALGVLRQLDVAPPSARPRAYALAQQSVAHAAARRSYETMATLERGDAELERSAAQAPLWFVPMPAGIGMLCGHAGSYLRLGKPKLAFEVLDHGRAVWPKAAYRASGELLVELSRAALEIGEVELACKHATAALQVASITGSRRQLRMLRTLAQHLERYAGVAAVREFRTQLALTQMT